jgi:ubiquinone/menaquinone biosynthesis C-methylase UbiE
MQIKEAYTDWSATYDSDRNLTRDLDQRVASQILGKLRCRSILELGCGTGKNTAMLAEIAEHVRAFDFSRGMLEKAREKVGRSNVTFAMADITRPWPVAAASIDLIVCDLVLEHISDLSIIFSEAARVLIAGGRFFVCELHPFRQYQGTVARFQREATTEITAFVHHLTDFTDHAVANGFAVEQINEWWHEEDRDKPPRLISFLFERSRRA